MFGPAGLFSRRQLIFSDCLPWQVGLFLKKKMMRKASDFLIKILSLGVGLSIAVVLLAKVCFEMSYDGFYKDVDRIYRVTSDFTQQGERKEFGGTSGAVAPGFRAEVPGVVAATRYTGVFNSSVFFDEDGNSLDCTLRVADSCFFDIFDREFLAGTPSKALKSWDGSVAVSRSVAERLGGVAEAVGKTIYNEGMPDLKLTVVGVYEDFPANGTLYFDALIGIEAMGDWSINNWMGNDRYSSYVKLAPGVDPASLTEPIRRMQEAHQDLESLEKNGTTLRYTLKPFRTMHMDNPDVRNMVLILSVVALLLLLVSVMNYILVAIGDVIRRSREVGVRKCFGAGNGTIYALLFKETALNISASLFVSVLLILAFRSSIESLIGVAVTDLMIPQTYIVLVVTILLVFLFSAMIPARMFIRIPVSTAFRGYKDSKRRWKLSLLAVQFAVNALLVSLMLVVSSQYRRSIDADPGYEYENVAYAYIPAQSQERMLQIAADLRALPEVEYAELTYCLPYEGASGNNIYLPGDDRELFNIADEDYATDGFFDLMGFRLIEGRRPEGPEDMAVSRSFVEKMRLYADWSDGAVGKTVRITGHNRDSYTICGVYEDYLIGSFEQADSRPSVRFCWVEGDRGTLNTIVVKFRDKSAGALKAANDVINRMVHESEGGRDIELTSYSDTFHKMYEETDSMRRTFTLGSVFAVLIAIIGLIGYVRDENYRRSGEIAVRKVNGAQTSQIVRMLVTDILKLAGAAVLVGDIGAWFIAGSWLSRFSDSIALGPGYFILADALVLVVVVLTVVSGSLKIARANPVDSLKQE